MAFFSFTSNAGSAELDPIVAGLGITGFFRKKMTASAMRQEHRQFQPGASQKNAADESSVIAQKSHSWSIFLPHPLTSIAPVGIRTAIVFSYALRYGQSKTTVQA